MPPGERKSGMPDSVEMPAPVKATMRWAEPIKSRSRSMSSMVLSCPRSRRRHGGVVHRATDIRFAVAVHLDSVGEQRTRLRIDAAPLGDGDGELWILGRRIGDRSLQLLRPAMRHTLRRGAAGDDQEQIARRHFQAPRPLAGAVGGQPLALIEALAAA